MTEICGYKVERAKANVERYWFEVYELSEQAGAGFRYILLSKRYDKPEAFPLYTSEDETPKTTAIVEHVATIYGFDGNVRLYTNFERLRRAGDC